MRIGVAVSVAILSGLATAEPLVLPFDFSRSAIELQVMVGATPLTMILDTGVDPSVIDLKTAASLHMAVDQGAGGEASGEGDAPSAEAYPAMQEGLSLGGHVFPPFPTLATDMEGLSAQYAQTPRRCYRLQLSHRQNHPDRLPQTATRTHRTADGGLGDGPQLPFTP